MLKLETYLFSFGCFAILKRPILLGYTTVILIRKTKGSGYSDIYKRSRTSMGVVFGREIKGKAIIIFRKNQNKNKYCSICYASPLYYEEVSTLYEFPVFCAWLSNLLTLSVLDEGYSRDVSCILKRSWWRLFQRRVVHTELEICVLF